MKRILLLCLMAVMAGCHTGHVIEIMVPDTKEMVERRLGVEQALYDATNAVAKEMGMVISGPPRLLSVGGSSWLYEGSYREPGGPSGFFMIAEIYSGQGRPKGTRVSVVFRALSDQADMAVTEKAFGIFAKEFNKLGLGYVVRRKYSPWRFQKPTRTEIKPSQ